MNSWRTSSTPHSNRALLLLLALGVVLTAALSLCLGAERINIFTAFQDMLRSEWSTPARILRYVRLPRTCAGLLAGAALASAGAIIQGVLSNSLAAPSTIGVNAGAGLAVALFTAIAPQMLSAVPLAALAGAFGGTMLVLAIAEHTSASKITLVLAGVAVSGIFSAGIDAIVTLFPDALNGYSDFRIGGLSGLSVKQLALPAVLITGAFLISLSLHNELDVLMLGTEQAQALGLSARKLRMVFLVLTSVLAGSAISFCGLIGFVGLLVPHMMRQLVGEESGPLLLSSALGGAILLCGCDLLACLLFAPYQLPVGIVMSLVGGPFFLLLLHRRGGHSHD